MPPLKIFNFLTRKKEVFKPFRKGVAGLYACGPTVYSYAHIGNLRTYIFEDVLRRVLERAGYKVKHVVNITDIDDKTIRGAKESGKTLKEFTDFYAKEFFNDINSLNILPAAKYPRATKHFGEMKKIVKTLLKKRYAYETEDGIYFDISKFRKYGRLSGLKKRALKSGARVAADEYSKDQAEDFALWKKKSLPRGGRPALPSGRPGWHLECSAMSMKYLGRSFDIHAGGVDLLFPHHENEIAQSEAATGKPFAKYFLEGEHLLVDGKKMSKSLGNIIVLRDLEKRGFDPLALRYLALSAHYRSQLNFTEKSLRGAENSLMRLREFVKRLKTSKSSTSPPNPLSLRRRGGKKRDSVSILGVRSKFQSVLSNDLNTPKALATVWDLVSEYNKNPQKFNPKAVLALLYDFDKVLGFGLREAKLQTPPPEALKLLKEREDARKAGDFKKADEIREKIRRLGWQIKDSPKGSELIHA